MNRELVKMIFSHYEQQQKPKNDNPCKCCEEEKKYNLKYCRVCGYVFR